jgi:hypothetical protein
MRGRLVLFGLMTLAARGSEAQGLMKLPNGKWGVPITYATTAMFSCGNYTHHSCTTNGNSVTLTNGGSTIIFSYLAAGGTFIPSTKGGQHLRVPVGTITKTLIGGPFTPAPTVAPRAMYVGMSLTMYDPTTYGALAWYNGGWTRRDTYLNKWHFGQLRNGYIHGIHVPDLTFDEQDQFLTVSATVNPEPSTWLMVASGLGGLGLFKRRKRI